MSKEIAVVGMALRAPGIDSLSKYWDVIKNGEIMLNRFSGRNQNDQGISACTQRDPNYVPVSGYMDMFHYFDPRPFGISEADARCMSPAHRQLLECAHEALEHAGINPEYNANKISVFVGCENDYLGEGEKINEEDAMAFNNGTRVDFASSQISFNLNLKGESHTVMAACATSLVAINEAVKSLRAKKSNIAIAGGATIITGSKGGYFAGENGMFSPTGELRPFDDKSNGTIFSNGAGAVVLMPLEDAIADNHSIIATILGTGTSNDGKAVDKKTFIAPSIIGQSEAIEMAISDAGIEPSSIDYIECHGTGTKLGDPIEIDALNNYYGKKDHAKKQYGSKCYVGSVKGNIGHTRSAAGVLSFIKACLSLKNSIIPPLSGFKEINAQIKKLNTSFEFTTQPIAWENTTDIRRAAVSSFGFGGANSHIIIEQAKKDQPIKNQSTNTNYVRLSGENLSSLVRLKDEYTKFLNSNKNIDPHSFCRTANYGRKSYKLRSIYKLIEENTGQINRLEEVYQPNEIDLGQQIVFLFPGQGAQFNGMTAKLYETSDLYRKLFDKNAQVISDTMGEDIKQTIFNAKGEEDRLNKTIYSQPSIFLVEISLAEYLIQNGATPDYLVGHSVGEISAAYISGILTLQDASKMIVERSRLMMKCDPGGMLAVFANNKELEKIMPNGLNIAAINSDTATIISGKDHDLSEFTKTLARLGIITKKLNSSHAFHSYMMEPMQQEYRFFLRNIFFSPQKIPIISTVTENLLSDSDIKDPEYWISQIRRTVRFNGAINNDLIKSNSIFVEVGPGDTLKGNLGYINKKAICISTTDQGNSSNQTDDYMRRNIIEKLWLFGGKINTPRLDLIGNSKIISIPTTAFQRKLYWKDDKNKPYEVGEELAYIGHHYQKFEIKAIENKSSKVWITDSIAPCELRRAIKHNKVSNDHILSIQKEYIELITEVDDVSHQKHELKKNYTDKDYWINIFRLAEKNLIDCPGKEIIVTIDITNQDETKSSGKPNYVDYNISLSIIKAAFECQLCEILKINLITDKTIALSSESDILSPPRAAVLGPIRSAKLEIPELRIRLINIDETFSYTFNKSNIELDLILRLAISSTEKSLFIIKDKHIYTEVLYPIDAPTIGQSHIRSYGVVFITGGTGSLGLECAEQLYNSKKARLALTTRADIPDRSEWDQLIKKDHALSNTFIKIRRIENQGGEVLLLKANSESYSDLQKAVNATKDHFGGVHAVIHAAGGSKPSLLVEEVATFPESLRGKPDGAIYLDQIFSKNYLDAFVLFSSIASKSGIRGQCAYIAANSVLDSLAEKRASQNLGFTKAIGWGAWQEIGMAMKKRFSRSIPSKTIEIKHPLLQYQMNDVDQTTFLGKLSPKTNWVVDAHRLGDEAPILAGTAQLSCMFTAASLYFGEATNIQIDSIEYIKTIDINENGSAFKILIKKHQGKVAILETYFCTSSDKFFDPNLNWELSSQALISTHDIQAPMADGDNNNSSLNLPDHPNRPLWGQWCRKKEHQQYCTYKYAITQTNTNECTSMLSIGKQYANEYHVNPAILDYMEQLALMEMLKGKQSELFYIPARTKKVIFWGPVTNTIIANSRFNPKNKNFDFKIFNETGIGLMQIEGFESRPQTRKIEEAISQKNSFNKTRESNGIKKEMNPNDAGLVLKEPGNLNTLELISLEKKGLDVFSVEIKVSHAGVNFKDLLYYLGQIPIEKKHLRSKPLGGEVSGYITKIGRGVCGLKVGDAVMGFAGSEGGFRQYVVTSQDMVTRIPSCISMQEAAGTPIVFCTALYSLVNLASIQEGQSVLIHSGAGGLGQAAIQICKLYKAKIFTTAGSTKKREYLASQGIKHIYNSRDASFFDEILKETNGSGIDVVLNSLSGNLMQKSLELTARDGHFIELGKRDLLDNSLLPMHLFEKGLNYHSFDLGYLMNRNEKATLKVLDKISELFSRNKIRPISTKAYNASESVKLFNDMTKSIHIGKKCISFGEHQSLWDSQAFEFYQTYGRGISINSGLSTFEKLLSTDNTHPYIGVTVATENTLQLTDHVATTDNPSINKITARNIRKLDATVVPATTNTEISLIEIWKEVLEIDIVGIDDDFFDLGGNSMMAIRILFKMMKLFKQRFPSDVLLDSSTVRQLASYVDDKVTNKALS